MTAKKKATKAKKPVKKAQPKKLVAENPPTKSQPLFDMKLTQVELVHLRDLFGVYLPPDGELTVSNALANAEGRTVAERLLFEKIIDLCKKAKLPTEEAAPDFIVGLVQNPSLSVFQISEDASVGDLSHAGTLHSHDDTDDDVEDIFA